MQNAPWIHYTIKTRFYRSAPLIQNSVDNEFLYLMTTSFYRGRIAPSPTGFLHLGHAKTFWSAYLRCQDSKGTLIYRDEDIDSKRCRTEFSIAAEEDLKRLGIRWDEGPIRQSERLPLYLRALEKLALMGCVYPCKYSRKEINQYAESHLSSQGEPLFPAGLRSDTKGRTLPLNQHVNWRFRVPDANSVSFEDNHLGQQTFQSMQDFGDFLVWRKDGWPTYELAVVVDDADMGITEVVRGEDLLTSTARQILVYEALGLKQPEFYHENLVKDESGNRLSKRKDSLALRTLFKKGHSLESLRQMWAMQS